MGETPSLLVNAAMLGSRPTGLGVYGERCLSAIQKRFDNVSVLTGAYRNLPLNTKVLSAPQNIAIDSGRHSALYRLGWSLVRSTPRDSLLYSPTQHGLMRHPGQIITIHDLISLENPEQHPSQTFFFKHVVPHLLRRSAAVFTVSATVREQIRDEYRFPLDRIFVVPNGVDRSVFNCDDPTDSALSPAEPYLLVVGAAFAHKNIESLLDAQMTWASRYRLEIVSARGSYGENLRQAVRDRGLQDRVRFHGYVPLAQLKSFYRHAAALVYPSKSEGFGIPALEAIASGAQVIASDIPVHREILADAAELVDTADLTSWSRAFERLHDARQAHQRRLAGAELIQRYSWDYSADALVKALLTVCPKLVLKA